MHQQLDTSQQAIAGGQVQGCGAVVCLPVRDAKGEGQKGRVKALDRQALCHHHGEPCPYPALFRAPPFSSLGGGMNSMSSTKYRICLNMTARNYQVPWIASEPPIVSATFGTKSLADLEFVT